MEKVLYQNTTQVSNFILDNLDLFSEGELKVVLIVTRKTIGWHKETDIIRYSQLGTLTGLSKPTLSKAVNKLVAAHIIIRVDENGRELKTVPQGYRGEISYTLNKKLTKEQLVKNFNQLNSLTSTGKKSLPYKTNSLQNSIIGKAQNIKNVENVGTTPLEEMEKKNVEKKNVPGQISFIDHPRPNGMVSIQEIMPDGIRQRTTAKKTDPIKTSHQAYAQMAIEKLDLYGTGYHLITGDKSSRIFARVAKALKDKPLYDIEAAIKKTSKKNIIDSDGRLKFFFKCLANGDNIPGSKLSKMQRDRLVSV